MVNNVGPADDFMAAGSSGVWDKDGNPLGQLDATNKGLLVYDAKAGEVQLENMDAFALNHFKA